jgi:hypothetical protein
LTDPNGGTLADPGNVVVGTPAIKVDRLLHAGKTINTRRI